LLEKPTLVKIKTMEKIEIVVRENCYLGENPLWNPFDRHLYWTDINRGQLYCFSPSGQVYQRCYQGETVGGFTLQADGSFLLFTAGPAVKIWRENRITPLIENIPDEKNSRFNDVIADAAGRVFCGTISPDRSPGNLYRLETGGTLRKLLGGLLCSNGMGFSPDQKYFYLTDSGKGTIYRFHYHAETGDISNQEVFIKVPPEEGVPDGLTVDAEGYLWSARYNGGCVCRYSPDGQIVSRLRLPVRKVTSVTFGGEEYRDLYITTAGGNQPESTSRSDGYLFRFLRAGRGLPEFFSRVGHQG